MISLYQLHKNIAARDIFAAAVLSEAIEYAKEVDMSEEENMSEEDMKSLVIIQLATSLGNVRKKALEMISTAEGKLAALSSKEKQ